jgi:DNA-binding transcriptional MerR regulator
VASCLSHAGLVDFSLAELAERTGTPARTIRYYISLNLLEGPVQAGRGAHYTEAHLARLEEIARLQRKGLSLAEIGAGGANKQREIPAPEGVWRYPVGLGVTVEVRSGLPPWQVRRVQRLIAEMAAHLVREDESGPPEKE